MKKAQRLIRLVQDLLIAFVLVFFAFDYSTQDYTSFSDSPPTISDKIWYVSEAVLFALFASAFVILNNALQTVAAWNFLTSYRKTWLILALFFTTRIIWEIIWVTTGMSANLKIAQIILFCIVLASTFCITYLPYLDKIFNSAK